MSTIKEANMATAIKLGAVSGIKSATRVKLGVATPAQVQAKPTMITNATQVVHPTSAGVTKTAENNSTIGKMMTEQELQQIALKAAASANVIASEMKAMFLEREEVIDSMFLSLIAGHHVLLLGPPGTGKEIAI